MARGLIIALLLWAGVARGELGAVPPAPVAVLAIEADAGRWERFTVEIARTPEEQAIGLMNRPWLAPRAGMAFAFSVARPAHFWMKNTLIPLDMIFVRADGTVESVAAMTEPMSEATWSSQGPVALVLEINGGLAAKLGIDAGDRVRWE